MQSCCPQHLPSKPPPSPSDHSFETAGESLDKASVCSSERGQEHRWRELTPESSENRSCQQGVPATPGLALSPPCSTSEADPRTPAYQHLSLLSERNHIATQSPVSTFTRPESDPVGMIGSLLSIIASISNDVSRMREHQENALGAHDARLNAHCAAAATVSASVEDIRGRIEGLMGFSQNGTVSASGDPTDRDTKVHHSTHASLPNSMPPQDVSIMPHRESALLGQLNEQRDAIANLTQIVEDMLEYVASQTHSSRSQADSCAALADVARRELGGTGTHTVAIKHLAEEVDNLAIKHMTALTNHGIALTTLGASVDAHSNKLVSLHKTVERLCPPIHAANNVSEAVLAVRSATTALEQLALGEIAAKNETLRSRTAAYTAERKKMAGEMAAFRARCNEAESVARTQIQAKQDVIRKLVVERDKAREEMFKTKEELYAATRQLCPRCTRLLESQRQQSWQS